MFADLVRALIESALVLVGSALAYSGFTKLRDFESARIGLLGYRLVGPRASAPLAALLGLSEVGVGLGILAGAPTAVAVGVLILCTVSLAALSALARGLDIDCHCAGVGERLTQWTLVRNAAMIGTLVIALLAAARGHEFLAIRGSLSGSMTAGVLLSIGCLALAVRTVMPGSYGRE